jgi:hypothetical protein
MATLKEDIEEALPAMGSFSFNDGSENFLGRIEDDPDSKKIHLAAIFRRAFKGLGDMMITYYGQESIKNLTGHVPNLGYVEFLGPYIKSFKAGKFNWHNHTIGFSRLLISPYSEQTMPSSFSKVIVSSHFTMNEWFTHSGFEVNMNAREDGLWNTTNYKPVADLVLVKTPSYTIEIGNHYFEQTRFEKYQMVEDKNLVIKFRRPQKLSQIELLLTKFTRFFQFAAGRLEPFRYLTLIAAEKQTLNYINNTVSEGDLRNLFTRQQALLPFRKVQNSFEVIFLKWIELEENMSYCIDRYSEAYNRMLTDNPEDARVGFVLICSALEIYFKNTIDTKGIDFNKALKKMIKTIQHPKILNCFPLSLADHAATTRNDFLHDYSQGPGQKHKHKVLVGSDLKTCAVKLKVLFEIMIMMDQFGLDQEFIYLHIKRPRPNTFHLPELH